MGIVMLDLWLLSCVPENTTTKSEVIVPNQDVYDVYMQ